MSRIDDVTNAVVQAAESISASASDFAGILRGFWEKIAGPVAEPTGTGVPTGTAEPTTPRPDPEVIRVDLEGTGHSTVTEHRSQRAVDAVLEFFGKRLGS